MAKAQNSHIHAHIQYNFSISQVNSPRKETLSQRGRGKKRPRKKIRLNGGKASITFVRNLHEGLKFIPFRDGE